jgi:hypothetical protein
VNEILELTDQDSSIALFGSIGVGKSVVARAVLDHDRTKTKFGEHRYVMRCNLINSLESFLARLSDAIHTDVEQLRSRLQSPPTLILLLDDLDSILDPLNPGSQKISETIEEFGSYEHVCIVTTSRVYPDIRGFHRFEVPTISEDGARDMFYGLCDLERSAALDHFITSLDRHPLSIDLLAGCVRKNHLDEQTLLMAWENDQTGVVRASYHRKLRAVIEPTLSTPTIKGLVAITRDVLGAIAAPPHGFEESELEKLVPGIGQGLLDALCKFSLVYREDGVVKMLLPARSYFLEFSFVPAGTKEAIRPDGDCMPAKFCMSFSFPPRYARRDAFKRPPHTHQWTPTNSHPRGLGFLKSLAGSLKI